MLAYRVGDNKSSQGLWYKPTGEFAGLIHDRFNFCTNSSLEMQYDEELVGWLSATLTLESLFHWFTREDIIKLQEYDYSIQLWEINSPQEIKFYERFQHYVIKQSTAKLIGTLILI